MPASSHAVAKRLVDSVLGYLSGMERLATMSNDRHARAHFEECWALTWRAYYGGYSLPVFVPKTLGLDETQPVPASKPPWLIAKYARPMRKVVARVEERVRLYRNAPALVVSFDVLECGHKVEGNENYGAASPARHRRCGQCVAQEGETLEDSKERRSEVGEECEARRRAL